MSETASLLVDRYELGKVIGRGGMAEVHLGRDTRLGRTVAIKILRADLARDPAFQARFRREAQSAASLNHPAIVAVYDTGEETINGMPVPFIVMEYVEGSTLRDLVSSGKRLLPVRAMEVTASVLTALEYSHRQGIVHRDIKPGNVMLTTDGRVKVMDFGIARALADTGAMTQTAAVMGTAQYLSPEQAKGEQVDARSDLYSTGCLLYELLTGQPPFSGDSPVSVAYQHVREAAAPPSRIDPEVPAAADAVTLKALEKNRDDRYQNAAQFRTDLEQIIRGNEPVTAVLSPVAGGAMGAAATTALPPYQQSSAGMGAPGSATMVAANGLSSGPPTSTYQSQALPPSGGKSKGGLGGVVLAVVVAAALLAVVVFMITQGNTNEAGSNGADSDQTAVAEQGTIPDVVGLTESQARSRLSEEGWTSIDTTEASSSQYDRGKVMQQNPKSGEVARHNVTVTLTISKGPEQNTLADLRGQTREQAVEYLTEQGASAQFSSQDSPQKEGIVLATSPEAGSTIVAGRTVTVTVSTGRNSLPNVVDQPFDRARSALRQAGFTSVKREEQITTDATARDDLVVSMSAQPGQSTPVDTQITVTVQMRATAGPPAPAPTTLPTTDTRQPTTKPPADNPGDPGDEDNPGNDNPGNGNGGNSNDGDQNTTDDTQAPDDASGVQNNNLPEPIRNLIP